MDRNGWFAKSETLLRDGDFLPDGETAEDNVSAAAAGENRLALAAAAAAAPAAAGP